MERPGQDALISYFIGECDAEEEKLITLYLAMDIDKEYITSCLKEAIERMKGETIPDWTEADQLKIWHEFEARKVQYKQVQPQKIRIWKKIAVAASLLICASAGLFYFKSLPSLNHSIAKNEIHTVRTDRGPGGNKAILTLADGKRIDLKNARSGAIAMQGKTRIIKSADGKLIYTADTETAAITSSAMNTLTTPRGGQYKLTLPDGSMVWLNAASSLQFPAHFTGGSREVTLNGEAYFEVAKNAKMPFRVKLNRMEVEVLGTHFNIMAYNDEPYIKTTLLEGSVRLTHAGNVQMLKPGQEGLLSGLANQFIVRSANIEQAMAWKNGQFIFANENMQSISRKLSRWYDIRVSDNRKDQGLTYTGAISKYKNVSDVLKMLELTGTLHYKIEDGTVTITNVSGN
jgi:transmembrane sensor